MKISVKQGRLMALMVAMIIIVCIFILGKMLGYGGERSYYLLEGLTTDQSGNDPSGNLSSADESFEHEDEEEEAFIEAGGRHDDEPFTCGGGVNQEEEEQVNTASNIAGFSF
jgi:hypothetical protein